MSGVNDVVQRSIGLFGGLIVAGLLGGYASGWMIGERGLPGPLLLLGHGGIGTAAVAVVVLALLTVVAIVAARLANSAVGMFVLGCGLGVLAMRCGTVSDLVFGATSPLSMSIETLVWAALVAVASFALFAGGGWLDDVLPAPTTAVQLGRGEGTSRSSLAPVMAFVAAGLIIPIVWLLLRNDLKGQALAATTIGGMVAGLFARLWTPHAQPWFVAAVAIAAMGVAQLVASVIVPNPLLDSFIRSDAPRVLAAMPIDIVAGALAGTAMGFGWSRSFVKEGHAEGEKPVVA